ncbi:hypothetical protein ACQKNB_10875 [Lysinibacillus xylanilyticus]|uniref:hypothetical protein n=1 Tax=Lysinibacillus xylanilyticus TaxID=582475 RepID=UPI003D07BDF8
MPFLSVVLTGISITFFSIRRSVRAIRRLVLSFRRSIWPFRRFALSFRRST